MKKLMMAFAVAIAAISLNAATVDWSVELGWVTETDTDDPSTLVGYLGYVFDGSTYTQLALQEALTTTGTTVLGNALGSSTVTADGELQFAGVGLSYDDTADPAWAKGVLVLIDSDAKVGSAFTVSTFADVEVTDAVTAGGAKFGTGLDLYTGAVSTWSTVAVPEPTSGLLLVVGGALLALRRRRLA